MNHKLRLLLVLLITSSVNSQAQFGSFRTKLKPETVSEFEAYARTVEAGLEARWSGKAAFLQIDGDAAAREKVMHGELVVQPGGPHNPHAISDGMIHDWYGAVFIPNATIARVSGVLQDFDHHSAIYPQVVKSRLMKRTGEDVTGYWRLEQKGQMVPAVFDVVQTVHVQPVAAGEWASLSHADDIEAVEDKGSKNERTLPPGEGMGLMWKLYSYWSLREEHGGVMAECRTVSLSRGVPGPVAWMIRPLLNSIPRESMDSTLRNTRKASGG